MKPSERIIQIFDKYHPNNPDKSPMGVTADMMSSIIHYLDEEYQKEEGLNH